MKIYFYGSHYDPVWVPHQCAVLAEGLDLLGHECYGEAAKMRPSVDSPAIIRESPGQTTLLSSDVIIVDSHLSLFTDLENELKRLFSLTKRNIPIVFIDESDGLRTPGFGKHARACDFVLKSHFNRKMKYPGSFVPWQFGISKRMMDAIHPLPVQKRKAAIAVNFRVKHQLRDYMNHLVLPIIHDYWETDTTTDNNKPEEFSPNDQFLFHQARGRHNPFYYQRISRNMAMAAYGGVFCLPFGNHDKYTAKICRVINHTIPLFKYDRIRQWDSWRFWESMLAGCITLHVDLEKFGCLMPVMPLNFHDYIGIDPYHPQIFKDWIGAAMDERKKGSPRLLENMSAASRDFVIKNYAPPVVAERFLDLLKKSQAPSA